MKRIHALALLLALTAGCAAPKPSESKSVRFEIVEALDAPLDGLALDEIWCDSPAVVAGATIRARGSYRLASADKAQLYFGLTNGAGSMSMVEVARGEGAFDLVLHATRTGSPHVSLYAGPVVNGGNCIVKRRFEIAGD